MRYWIVFLLGILSAAAQTPTVTITGTDGLSHSVVRVKFNVSASYSALRMRYIASPGTCTGGTGGSVQTVATYLNRLTSGMADVVAGLIPNTTYKICPEVTADGTNWSSGVGVTITTLPIPAVHPAPPIAPATFNTDYPDTTGYKSVTVATDCSDLQSRINTAMSIQASTGTIINIPAATVCSPSTIHFAQRASDVVTFLPAAVDTVTSEINLPSHGLTEGQTLQFGKQYGSLSSFPQANSCEFGLGFSEGQTYYAHVIDSNHIRVFCPDHTTLMTFTNQGNASNFFEMVSFPRKLQWIIIRSAAPNNELPPEHTRITPAWHSKMASLVNPVSNLSNTFSRFLLFGDVDGNDQFMSSNIRIGPGIEITTADSPEAHQSSDPQTWRALIAANVWNSNITFDRCWIHGQGTPNRITSASGSNAFVWDGAFQAIVDSYFDGLVYFHTMYSGLGLTKTNATHFTIDPGTETAGGAHINLNSKVTAIVGGSGSGRAYAYFDIANSNALTVSVPAGVTVSCSPVSCASAVAGTNNGSCALWSASQGSRDGWPTNGWGDPIAAPIGCIDVASGSISTVSNADSSTSEYMTEGSNFMIGGRGPGPYKVENTYIEGAGLLWHHDGGNSTQWIMGDYSYIRNTFKTPLKYMYGGPLSDGMRYFLRQPLEWKAGRRISLSGNIFDGEWVEVTPASVFVAFTSVAPVGITDVDITNNTFAHGPGVTNVPLLVDGGAIQTLPPNRFRFQNNLAWDIGSSYWVPQGGATAPKGWVFEGPYGGEDVTVNHNTIAGNNGSAPAIFWLFDTKVEGVSVTNNFFNISAATQGVAQDGSVPLNDCTGIGKALADCKFTGGYVFDHNVLMSSDSSQSTVQSWWPSLNNYVPSDMSLTNAGWLSYAKHDFHVISKYCSGCAFPGNDRKDVGADIDALQSAQGKVTLIGVPEAHLTSTSAVVGFVAPDSMGCPVDYSSSDPSLITGFARVSDSGGARPRNITLSGLASKTLYYYRVNCAVEQPTGEFRTR
jgi:hypothetical protein